MIETNVIGIEKEEINTLTFPKESISRTELKVKQLHSMLDKAVLLGNRYKDKIRVVFRDSVGLKMVETTIWHASQNHVVLKGGVTIPFNRIEEVRL